MQIPKCKCGCGEDAPIIINTDNARGRKKGEFSSFIKYHRKSMPISERLEQKSLKTNYCWLWTGSSNRKENGYGTISVNGKQVYVHRIVYEINFGLIPAGMVVMHTCDNPACCNPAHLRLGTPKENTVDMISKSRQRIPERGEEHYFAKLTEREVREIFNLRQKGAKCIDLSKQFNISPDQISAICLGKKWKHLGLVK